MPLAGARPPSRNVLALAACLAAVVLTALLAASDVRGESAEPGPTERDPIVITADIAHDWQDEQQACHVWLLRGHCRIEQGDTTLQADKMVVWVQSGKTKSGAVRDRIAVYLEDGARVENPVSTVSEQTLLLDLVTREGVKFRTRRRVAGENAQEDALYHRALARRTKARRPAAPQVQRTEAAVGDIGPELKSIQIQPPSTGTRRIRIFQRSAVPYNVYSFETPNTTPPEQVWILTGGVNLIIEGVAVDGMPNLGTINLSADRMVIWTQAAGGDLRKETVQSKDTPLQIYLEDNIIFRQGENVVRARRAFYDVSEKRALLKNVEMKVRLPEMPVQLRVRAEELRQLSEKSYHAQNAWATTSQFGKPGYRIEASDLLMDERPTNRFFQASATSDGNPETADAPPETLPWVTAVNAKVKLNDTPVFFAPKVVAPGDDFSTPIRRLSGAQDRVFGTQLYTGWDMLQLLGAQAPPGTDLNLLADYYSQRGPGLGLNGDYQGAGDVLGTPGEYFGTGLVYGVYDTGTDNLGLDRRSLQPKNPERGRVLWRHRHLFENDLTLQAEVGVISDRNFLEQYYESEWDIGKDNETLIYAKQQRDNWAWSVLGKAPLNQFDTVTGWAPKGDFYTFGEPLLGDWLTWTSRSTVGYGILNPAQAPTDPNDLFSPLPYVASVQGAVLSTRHELDAPFDLGPVHFVPYALGEAAYWSEDLQGNPLGRLYGSAGVRGSLLFSKIFPNVHSDIFGLRGLAHKMLFDFDYSLSQSTASLSDIAQYNEFDDVAQYRFRNRLLVNTFGGTLPPEFDPRFYAVRLGADHNVTAPYNELVADQQVLRMGWRHRLQTKVGPVDAPRIRDWMTLDLEASYFPNAARDNFGQDFGLLSGRYMWNVGDRTTLFANAFYDTFADAQQLWSVGMLSQRTTRGSVYLGVRQVKGAGLDSQILTASYSYAMSPKWVSTIGTAYDLAENRNRGQSLTLTRVGADFLLHIGANFDQSKNNAGIGISLEPKFFPFSGASAAGMGNPQLGSLTGGY